MSSRSNAADGYLGDWLPHKDSCRCTDCQLDKVQRALDAEREKVRKLRDALNYLYRHAEERLSEHELETAERALSETEG